MCMGRAVNVYYPPHGAEGGAEKWEGLNYSSDELTGCIGRSR